MSRAWYYTETEVCNFCNLLCSSSHGNMFKWGMYQVWIYQSMYWGVQKIIFFCKLILILDFIPQNGRKYLGPIWVNLSFGVNRVRSESPLLILFPLFNLKYCYGLNVCILPGFLSCSPKNQCDGTWRWSLQQVIGFGWGHECGALVWE